MGRGRKTKIAFQSNARYSTISEYRPQKVVYSDEPILDKDGNPTTDTELVATFVPRTYRNFLVRMGELDEKPIKGFPIIFRDNGEPWDLGNLYLQKKFFNDTRNNTEVSMDSYISIAKGLEMFLRWLETVQKKGDPIDEYYFPADELQAPDRVTYRYHSWLQNQLGKIPQVISISTAKVRMSAVIGMYRGCLEWGLFQEKPFEGAPFKEREVGIAYLNRRDMLAIRYAVTTDITFYTPDPVDDPDTVEGTLRPLISLKGRDPKTIKEGDIDEQQVIVEQLAKYGNRTFELICLTALETGARLQTVCTLRIEDLKNLKAKKAVNGEYRLRIGHGYNTDLKKEKQHKKSGLLFLPEDLVDQLLNYCDSDEAVRRRNLNKLYGDSDANYVFLSEYGEAFYTSYREFNDLDNANYSRRQDIRERSDANRKVGKAIEGLMHRFRKFILIEYPEFRHFKFHDFRATYGVNYVREAISNGMHAMDAVEQLRQRMCHNQLATTLGYLEYSQNKGLITEVEDNYFDSISKKSLNAGNGRAL